MELRIGRLQASACGDAQSLLLASCAHDSAASVASELLYGTGASGARAEPLGAWMGQELVALACTSKHWLRILAVHPRWRNQGIGSQLLQRCEVQMDRHGETMVCMGQPGNYLSPGIDVQNEESIAWLARRGYSKGRIVRNLLVSLLDNPKLCAERLSQARLHIESAGYMLMRLCAQRWKDDLARIAVEFSEGWSFEAQKACRPPQFDVHIAVEKKTQALAGFAVHDGNNRGLGWFGPTGTFPAHRGRGIGSAVLLACMQDIATAGHHQAEVAWVGPEKFYEKVVGVSGVRKFVSMKKKRE